MSSVADMSSPDSRDNAGDDDRDQSKRIGDGANRMPSHRQGRGSRILPSKDVDQGTDERVEEELETLYDDERFPEILGLFHLGAKGQDGHVRPKGLWRVARKGCQVSNADDV